MIRWLFDTDHLSLNERGHTQVRQRLAAVQPESVALRGTTSTETVPPRLSGGPTSTETASPRTFRRCDRN